MPPLRVIFAASGAFAVPTLGALSASGLALPLVVSQPDRPAGRGRALTPTPVAAEALARGLPLLRSDDINAADLPEADALVVIAFGQKIGAALASRPRLGAMNLHASLLPRWRGAAPIHHAVLAGDEWTGNSVIRLAERMDAGAVLGQSRVRIGPLETSGELHDRLAADGAALVLRVLEDLATGRATETPQDETLATPARKLSKEAGRLDFAAPADEVARRIRAMHPWPACRCRAVHDGREIARLTFVRAAAVAGGAAPPGQIAPDGSIACGDGAVRIVELQPEGGRAMSLEDYRRGRAWPTGARVEAM